MVPMRVAVSTGAVSWVGAEGRGLVGDDELQALTTREAIATTTNVRWRRDMSDSGGGTDSSRGLLSRT